MGVQQFDSSKANAAAKKIRANGDRATEAIQQVKKEIRGMTNGWWKGETSQAFSDQFDELEPNLKKLAQLINDIATQLESVASAKDSFELEMQRKIRG